MAEVAAYADPVDDIDPAAGPAGGAGNAVTKPVPFPADEIGKPGKEAVRAGGRGAPPDDGAGAGRAREETSAADRLGAAATALNGKLDSGRQAMRRAMTGSNAWLSGRSAKSEPAGSPAGDSGFPRSSGFSGGASSVGAGPSGRDTGPAAGGGIYALGRSVTAPTASFSPRVSPAPGSPARPGPDYSASHYRGTGAAAAPLAAPDAGPADRGAGTTSAGPAAAGPAPAGRPPEGYSPDWSSRPAPGARWQRKDNRRSRRQAQLTLARVEPWSVMKFSFMVSVVAFIILFIAVALLYMVLSGLGVFDSLQHTIGNLTSAKGTTGTNISAWFSASRVLGYTAMLGAFNIVLITAMSTIGAVIYNLIAHTIGGIEVTLRETD